MALSANQGLSRPKTRPVPVARWLGTLLPLVGGLSISALLFHQARTSARQALYDTINDQAEKRVELLRTQILRSMEVLHSVAAVFVSHPQSTAADFHQFVARALARQPELQALGWSPRVTRAQRSTIEQELHRPGAIPSGIVERSAYGEFVPAADRPEYFPVRYIEPVDQNDAVLGFDLASSKPRRDALELARFSDQPAATAPIQLVQGRPGQLGFVVYLACFAPSTEGANGHGELTGYSSAVFRLATLLHGAAAESTRDGMDLRAVDNSTGALLFESTPDLQDCALCDIKSIDVAGRQWTIKFLPRAAFVAQHQIGHEWIVLGTGISITLLLTVYLYGGLRRTLEIERRVFERTAQLSAEVAERRRAASAARLAEAKYRSIFENSVEGIFQTSPSGRYLSANSALARIYGYESPDQLMADLGNIAIQLYVLPGRRDAFATLMRESGTVAAFESQVYRRDGTVIWISESARSVCDERGNLLYYEGAVVDITERKSLEAVRAQEHDELEARVRERTEALAAANAAKSRFLASMSHEIRTPMNAILGYAQLLRRDPTLRDTQREAMATIVSSGNHLLGLIDEILDLSRIEAGHLELQSNDFDLRTLVSDLANMFRQRCEQKGVVLCIELPEGERMEARGDEQKLRQVLVNLIGNAIRFTDAGTITLVVRRESALACGFEVADTGIGIPREAIAKIFEPFQQASSGAGRGGSGLGLAIARQHVRLMGGELGVESVAAVGSRFHFTIPLPPCEVTTPSLATRAGSITHLAAGQRVRAVIIDDVRENRLVLSEMLQTIGCETVCFESGRAAIDCFAGEPSPRPDIFFVDMLMPELNGTETANLLRQMPALSGVRLVATSAAACAHEQEQYARSGFHDVVTKPIVCERLYECLASLLEVKFDCERPREADALSTESPAGHRATQEAAALPSHWRERLRQAAELCSVTELRGYADALEELVPPATHLARRVRACLQTYDTAPLLQLLEVFEATATNERLEPTGTGAMA